jgi:DNA polymerase-3 subunit delta'
VPFADIIGHKAPVELLTRAVARDRVPQSLLFGGPEGVGKRAVALALAQAVNCPNQKEGDACGTCNFCRRIAGGRFPGVVLVGKDGEASIKIKAVRDKVLDLVGYRPFEGARHVFIIEPADDLVHQAQEALLKTLEEPPPSAILILITAFPDLLLGTTRSRCRRVRFGALGHDEVARVLMANDRQMDPAEATARAAVSGGSVERAIRFDMKEFGDDRAAAVGLLAAAQRGGVPDRLKAAATFASVEKKRRVREAAATRLAILSSLLRDLTVLDARQAQALANTDLINQLQRMSASFNATRLLAAFAAVNQAETSIDRNASPKIVADWLAVTM